jgi:GT2 family glycosyltransferase
MSGEYRVPSAESKSDNQPFTYSPQRLASFKGGFFTHQAKAMMLSVQTSALKALQICCDLFQPLQWACLVDSQSALATGDANRFPILKKPASEILLVTSFSEQEGTRPRSREQAKALDEQPSALSTQHSALLSIIIPNWNGGKFLPTCLDALGNQTYPSIEVIIADNASRDGSQELIRSQYPQVTLVELAENRGFTGACNAGIQVASGVYIALLNNDTEVDVGWAAAVVGAFEQHPEIGIVASKMLLFDKRDHIHTAGDYFTLDGRAGNRGVWQKDEGQFDTEEYVFGACGGSSVYRKTMLDQIGILDNDFFFSLEDIDLAWRAQLTGWRCLYTPKAIVYHHLSATGGGVTASYYDGRNLIFTLVKNYPTALWRKHGWRILQAQFKLAWEAARAWRGEAARARLRGMWAGLWQSPRMWRKRCTIQSMRRITIEELEAVLSPAQD